MKFRNPFDDRESDQAAFALIFVYAALITIAMVGMMAAIIVSHGLLLLFIVPFLLFFVLAGDGDDR
jgi:hypothetical protein